jgi:hypothetical protein
LSDAVNRDAVAAPAAASIPFGEALRCWLRLGFTAPLAAITTAAA